MSNTNFSLNLFVQITVTSSGFMESVETSLPLVLGTVKTGSPACPETGRRVCSSSSSQSLVSELSYCSHGYLERGMLTESESECYQYRYLIWCKVLTYFSTYPLCSCNSRRRRECCGRINKIFARMNRLKWKHRIELSIELEQKFCLLGLYLCI